MIAKERLEEIARNIMKSHGWEGNETEEEKAYIKSEWMKMPGHYSYYSAIITLIKRTKKS